MLPIRDDNPTSRRPYVTLAVIIACVAVYLLWQPTPLDGGGVDDYRFNLGHATVPVEIRQGGPMTVLQVAQATGSTEAAIAWCGTNRASRTCFDGKNPWLSLLLTIFLHGSVAHLAGNMLFLWIFGNNVEDRLGHVAFALFYVVGGVVASLAHVAVDLQSTVPIVGASGAIAAVMGAYAVWFPRARVRTLIFVGFVFWPRIQARWVLLAWFVLQFFTNPNEGVAWVAHVGGFVFGAVVAWVLRGRGPVRGPRATFADPYGVTPGGWPPPRRGRRR